jgi:hypothetical protein
MLGRVLCMLIWGTAVNKISAFLKYSVESVLWSSLQKSDFRNLSSVDFALVVGPYSLTSLFSVFSHSPLLKTR